MKPLCCLWEKKSDRTGITYLIGSLREPITLVAGDVVLAFKNNLKNKQDPRSPDYRLFFKHNRKHYEKTT